LITETKSPTGGRLRRCPLLGLARAVAHEAVVGDEGPRAVGVTATWSGPAPTLIGLATGAPVVVSMTLTVLDPELATYA